MLNKIAYWERIIQKNLFTFNSNPERDSNDVHLIHYFGIKLLSDVPLTAAAAATATATQTSKSTLASVLMRQRADDEQLLITHISITFESHKEPLVTLKGLYQPGAAVSEGGVGTDRLPLMTWHTVLSVWQQFAQRANCIPNP